MQNKTNKFGRRTLFKRGAALAGGVVASALGQVQFLAAGVLGKIKMEWTIPGAHADARK